MSNWIPQPDGLAQLLTCLRNSDSADTTIQQSVTKHLDSFNEVPDYNSYLAYILSSMPQEDARVRSVAGLILKNNLRRLPYPNPILLQDPTRTNTTTSNQNSSNPPSLSGSQQTLEYVKSSVLSSGLLSDPVPMLRATAGTLISTIVMQFGPESWPQALQTLIELTEANEPLGKEGAFSTLSKICEDVPRKLEHMQINGTRVLDIMIPRLINHLKNPSDSRIRAYALICLNPFIQTGGDGSLTDNLQSYVEALFLSASDRSPEVRKNVCSALVSLLSSNPDVLIPNLSQTVDFMLYSTQETDEGVALEACEFWLAFGEDIRLKNYLAGYLEKIVPVLLKGMIYSEEDLLILDNDEEDEAVPDRQQDIKPRFYGAKDARTHTDDSAAASPSTTHPASNIDPNQSDDRQNGAATGEDDNEESELDEDGDSDEDDIYAEWNLRKCSAAALDVIAVNFENSLLEYLLPILKEYLFQPKWEHKEAAILALGAIAEGCLTGMEPHLSTLIPILLDCLKDRKALVRSITCWTLGRYSSWIISPGSTTAEHKQAVFLPVMEGNKRVQEAGCSAFATLEEEAGEELEPYLLPILSSLVTAFRKYQHKNLLILYDALGTLADSVGSSLAKPELLQVLMPSLIERWQKLADDEQDLIPLLECLSSVVIAIGPAFGPYAPAVFERCVRLVANNLEVYALSAKHPGEYEPPDKTFLIVALDLLSGLTQGLAQGMNAMSNPTNNPSNRHALPPILSLLGSCLSAEFPEPSVRQSAFALVGDCAISCYPLLESYLPQFMPQIIRQIDAEAPITLTSVCNNAAWAAGEISIKAGEKMAGFIEPLLSRLVPILNSTRVARSLTENAAVTIGRLSLSCPHLIAPHLDQFIRQWCQALAEIKDNDEKDSAFRGMCLAIEIYPHGLIRGVSASGSTPSADGADRLPNLSLKFKSLLHAFKNAMGENQWAVTLAALTPQTAQRLQVAYQV
ncbi:uncharacterized protein PGTG_05807 [Puccinia graminis f. sp. tritici CRL 75-36-700-3]|uniref:Importin N-terminal domain-containing protein n=1 Tax=Puccinia graminis f. sp. tritici (strain CRL 75-36-700-3 / race SCCL) TaxID=418459 RepID=E3K5R5_PUCGT|nr:uncharacterized protein PGTG_05807 [Puccinia graminis f. sp. tritici CRL 75-36-700-3]EFP79486.2 hypothetical protein PGTG_05807 [Puccinia graminis f. sp. tritici CRL 75-36-700-3]